MQYFENNHVGAFSKEIEHAIPVIIVEKHEFKSWFDKQSPRMKALLVAQNFSASLGEMVMVFNVEGALESVCVGYGQAETRIRGRFYLTAVAQSLPEGIYKLVTQIEGDALFEAALGWLLAAYKFDRYKAKKSSLARLICPEKLLRNRLEIFAKAEMLTRDLVNIPANDMGPSELEIFFQKMATYYRAQCDVIEGEELLKQGFPLIHAVGRASARPPRLIDMRWGREGPSITLVGKGICFDTGGLNIKPGNSMGLMKKDMGGAANVIGLGQMLMALEKKISLRLLIPVAENSISGSAFRPGDILTARNGLTIEVNNTDAEGRLVLADALALASEDNPDLIISMATLTGAARIALGEDLSPFFANDTALSCALQKGAKTGCDPVWELPFWAPYETMIEPDNADLDNAPAGGFAGAIVAALFLRRFVGQNIRYAHFDIFSWRSRTSKGWSRGGLGQGGRAILHALENIFAL